MRVCLAMKFFDFVYDYIFILQIVAVSISILIVFYPFEKTMKSWLIAALHLLGLFAACTLLNWGFLELSEKWRFLAGINFQLAWLVVIVLYLFVTKINILSRITMGAVLFTSVLAATELGRQVMFILPKGTDWSFINNIFHLLICAFGLVVRWYTLRNYSSIPVLSVVIVAVGAVLSSGLVICKDVMNVRMPVSQGDLFYIFTLVVLYVLNMSTYLIIYFHCREWTEVSELQIKNRLLEADKQMLMLSDQAIAELRQIRHDIGNQLKVIELMVVGKQYDELAQYFSSVKQSVLQESGSPFIDCGNMLINSVINMEILKANNYGVQLVTKISVPTQLPFEKSDLCRILVNLLDNAIEGICRAESKDYLIDCKILKRADYLYICVQNHICDDCDRVKLLEMNTEKTDTKNHGYGHRIVKRIVEKYNGAVKYKIEENEFIAEIMLDMTSVTENKNG